MTPKQRKALHLYLRNLAEALDEAGLDMQQVVSFPIRPTMENVKETMFRRVMGALYPDIESTEGLTEKQVADVYENLNRGTAVRLGISVRWPSEDDLRNRR